MLRHIVLIRFAPEADQAAIDRYAAEARRLAAAIGGVRSYVAAPDAARTIAGVEGNADFAVVADFDDYAAFQAYTSHEAHKRLASDLLAPVLGSRTAIQIEIPGR